jgi:hypothetical protein
MQGHGRVDDALMSAADLLGSFAHFVTTAFG